MAFSGLPTSMAYFAVDAGLGILAETASENGIDVHVRDFDNIEVIKKCMPSNPVTHLTIDAAKLSFFERAETLIWAELKKVIESENILCVGFKVWFGPSLSSLFKILKKIKSDFPHVIIMLGGPSLSAVGPEIISFIPEEVDCLTFGEGEETIKELAPFLRSKIRPNNLSNTYIRSGNTFVAPQKLCRTNLSNTPMPSYTQPGFQSITREKLPLFIIDDGRGCAVGCPFCSHTGMTESTQRTRTPDSVAEHILNLNEKFQGAAFRLAGPSPLPVFLNSLSAILPRNHKRPIRISSFLHPGFAAKVDFTALYAAGFRGFLLGIESVNALDTSSFTGKKFDLGTLQRLGTVLNDAGMFSNLSFIIPGFEQNQKHLENFLETTSFSRQRTSILTSFPQVFPSTDWWQRPEKYGISIPSKLNYLHDQIFENFSVDAAMTLNGRNLATLIAELNEIKVKIRNIGFSLNIQDETPVLADLAGLSPLELGMRSEYFIKTLDLGGIENLFLYLKQQCGKAA